jgi:hypothetical protein
LTSDLRRASSACSTLMRQCKSFSLGLGSVVYVNQHVPFDSTPNALIYA